MAEKPRQMRVFSHILPASGVRVARFATPFGPEAEAEPEPEPEPGGGRQKRAEGFASCRMTKYI